MSNKRPSNLYDRQQNKKALEKKARAKARHFGVDKEHFLKNNREEIIAWPKIEENEELLDCEVSMVVRTTGKNVDIWYGGKVTPDCEFDRKIPSQLKKSLVVGDKVYINWDEDNKCIIKSRKDRSSFLSRIRGDSTRFSSFYDEEQVIAANVDICVIVASTINPKFHTGLIDRYLVICQNGRVAPLIALNKCDLTDERSKMLDYYRDELKVEVVEVSALEGRGIVELKEKLKNKIAVLVGNSGVGKSTIINSLIKGLDLKTREVSEKHGEGKHTTTATNLYQWDENSYIIDTPGIRSLGVDYIDKESLKNYFPEFEKYSYDCKYRDCTHDHELKEDCGVKRAVEEGKINQQRYDSYVRMMIKLI